MKVTMKDIARMANVSRPVVCSVLGGRSTCHVSEEKRKRILELVREYDYQPNAQARGLRLGKTYTVGILMANFRDRAMAILAMGLYREFLASGYASTIAVWESLKEIEQAYANCIRGNVDGIVTCDWHPEWLTEKKPAVVYGRHDAEADTVAMDYETGLREAFAYLRELGHRKFAFIGERSSRQTGFLNVAKEEGVEFSVYEGGNRRFHSEEYGAVRMRAILEKGDGATAIFCHNDTMALTAMAEAQRAGLTPGKDLSFVGLDNISESALSFPPLTTIDTFVESKAGIMARMMLDRLKNPDSELRHVTLKTKLVIRGSCGPATKRDER